MNSGDTTSFVGISRPMVRMLIHIGTCLLFRYRKLSRYLCARGSIRTDVGEAGGVGTLVIEPYYQ